MLSRAFRLTKTDIERVYKKGRTFREDFLLARILGNNIKHFRFAIVISKKIAPKATQRTRLKRKTFVFLKDILRASKAGDYDVILSFKGLPEEKDIQPVLSKILARAK